MTACLARVIDVITAGKEAGECSTSRTSTSSPTCSTPSVSAGPQLARLGVIVREETPGNPGVAGIDQARLKEHLMTSSLALVRRVERPGGQEPLRP